MTTGMWGSLFATQRIRPHDLIRVDAPARLVDDVPRPGWVASALERAPWVVVRRLAARGHLVPVGVRGLTRDQRHGCWLPAADVVFLVTPEELSLRRDWRHSPRVSLVPALAALGPTATALDTFGWEWGPVGSVGFELASGAPTATARSDLDIVVRPQTFPSQDELRALTACLSATDRCDASLETEMGALSLAEYASHSPSLMLRTNDGPRLMTRAEVENRSRPA